jgi:hypothetical protein
VELQSAFGVLWGGSIGLAVNPDASMVSNGLTALEGIAAYGVPAADAAQEVAAFSQLELRRHLIAAIEASADLNLRCPEFAEAAKALLRSANSADSVRGGWASISNLCYHEAVSNTWKAGRRAARAEMSAALSSSVKGASVARTGTRSELFVAYVSVNVTETGSILPTVDISIEGAASATTPSMSPPRASFGAFPHVVASWFNGTMYILEVHTHGL